MKIGRRKLLSITYAIALVGLLISCYENFIVINVGRFLFGLSCGLQQPVIQRYIEETAPQHLYSTVAPTFILSQSIGIISAYFLAEILPDPKGDFETIKDNTTWRVIYAYWPIALTVIATIGHAFIVDHDSIKFLIM